MSHIFVNIGSGNGLSPVCCQAIVWINDDLFSIEPIGTNFNEIWVKIHTFSFTFSLKQFSTSMLKIKKNVKAVMWYVPPVIPMFCFRISLPSNSVCGFRIRYLHSFTIWFEHIFTVHANFLSWVWRNVPYIESYLLLNIASFFPGTPLCLLVLIFSDLYTDHILVYLPF